MSVLVFCIDCRRLVEGIPKPSTRFKGNNILCDCGRILIGAVSAETARIEAL